MSNFTQTNRPPSWTPELWSAVKTSKEAERNATEQLQARGAHYSKGTRRRERRARIAGVSRAPRGVGGFLCHACTTQSRSRGGGGRRRTAKEAMTHLSPRACLQAGEERTHNKYG